jgi:hypothetical protein
MDRKLQVIRMKEGYGSMKTCPGKRFSWGITGINVTSRECFRTITMIHKPKGKHHVKTSSHYEIPGLLSAGNLIRGVCVHTYSEAQASMDDTAITTKVKSAIFTDRI